MNNTYVGLPNFEYCKQDTKSHEELYFPNMKILSNNLYPTSHVSTLTSRISISYGTTLPSSYINIRLLSVAVHNVYYPLSVRKKAKTLWGSTNV
jgi:hypothetical protein